MATGKVTDACYPRHRNTEFLKFLKQVAKAYPRVPLHIVCDNYGTRQAIHRGSFAFVAELTDAIRTFIDAWNERCEPLTRNKTPDEIFAELNPQTTPATTH